MFREDVERHHSLLRESGVWAMVAYRVGAYAQKVGPGPLRQTARAARGCLSLGLRLLTRTSLAADMKAGEGLLFVHAVNLTIGPGVVLGERVVIMQDVTIDSDYATAGAPKIGNDVFIGAGATVLGNVRIGDGAAVAPNSLVVTDIPVGAFAIGVPAKVIRWGKGSGVTVSRNAQAPKGPTPGIDVPDHTSTGLVG
jgi:serine O-acetyltransferase